MEIEVKLQDIAESQGHNLNHLILHSGVSVGTVRAYWHKKAKRVDLDVLARFCELLSVEPSAMIGWKETPCD